MSARTRTVDEGDRIDLGESPDGRPDWALEVFHLPGHSRDHLAFRDNRYGQVLAGDLISTLSSILIDPSEGDLTTYLHSLKRLQELSPGLLYPGHGPPARDGARAVAKQIRHRQRREQQILDALSDTGRDLDSLLEEIYAGTPPEVMSLARRSFDGGHRGNWLPRAMWRKARAAIAEATNNAPNQNPVSPKPGQSGRPGIRL